MEQIKKGQKMKLEKEDIDFIKNLSIEMKTQDNRATASPYALVIQEDIIEWNLEEGKTGAFWNETQYLEDDFDSFVDDLAEMVLDDKEDADTRATYDYIVSNGIKAFCELGDQPDIDLSIGHYEIRQTSDSVSGNIRGNFFLTEKSAKKYINANSHNLRNPRTYGIHLYRNPEMEKLYEIIHKLADEL